MSKVEMVAVKSSNVRAIGLDGARILVQFDNGSYECVPRGEELGRAGSPLPAELAKETYERFLAASSKGSFYNSQIRRQSDVWRVTKLTDIEAAVEATSAKESSGIEVLLAQVAARGKELGAGRDFTTSPHGFVFDPQGSGMATDFCRDCGLSRLHPVHAAPLAAQTYVTAPEEVIDKLTPASVALHPFVLHSLGGIEADYCLECGEARKHPSHGRFIADLAVEDRARKPEGRRELILTVGLPRSGKSSWARATGFPVVSPDAVRLALTGEAFNRHAESMVWVIVRIMVRAMFAAGHETVVLDACNVTRERRDEWRVGEWTTVFQVFEATREECRAQVFRAQRALLSGIGAGIYNAEIAEEVSDTHTRDLLEAIDRMAKNFEPLGTDEAHYKGRELNTSHLPGAGVRYADLMAPEVIAQMAEEVRAMQGKTGRPPEALDDVKPGGKGKGE